MFPVYVYGTERHGTRSAQGFKGGKGQKLTKKQKRMEAMQKNKSLGVRDECLGAVVVLLLIVYSYLGICTTPRWPTQTRVISKPAPG